MLNRHQTIGILSAFSILSLSSQALADQSSHQSVSGTTRASGESATALSHTEQSGYQSGAPGTQQLWQSVGVGTLAEGQGSSAATQVTQSATQNVLGEWADTHTLLMLQSAGIDNAALGDWSTAASDTEQSATQILVGF
jgi:hypothetical protein